MLAKMIPHLGKLNCDITIQCSVRQYCVFSCYLKTLCYLVLSQQYHSNHNPKPRKSFPVFATEPIHFCPVLPTHLLRSRLLPATRFSSFFYQSEASKAYHKNEPKRISPYKLILYFTIKNKTTQLMQIDFYKKIFKNKNSI